MCWKTRAEGAAHDSIVAGKNCVADCAARRCPMRQHCFEDFNRRPVARVDSTRRLRRKSSAPRGSTYAFQIGQNLLISKWLTREITYPESAKVCACGDALVCKSPQNKISEYSCYVVHSRIVGSNFLNITMLVLILFLSACVTEVLRLA